MSAIALTATTKEELDGYAREQFDKIREARKALAEEKAEASDTLTRRRQELETQAHNVLARMAELQDREQRLTNLAHADSAELNDLQTRLQEQDFRLELLEAEKDAAWAQVERTQEDWQKRLDATRAEFETQSGEAQEFETQRREAQERIEMLSKLVSELSAERDQALSKLRQWPTREVVVDPQQTSPDEPAKPASLGAFGLQHTNIELPDVPSQQVDAMEFEQLRMERNALLERVAQLQEEADQRQADAERFKLPSAEQVQLADPSISDFGLEHTDLKLPELSRELEGGNATPQFDAMEVDQLRSERDALRTRLEQLQEDLARHQTEFAAIRERLEQEAQQLAFNAHELCQGAVQTPAPESQTQLDLDRQFIAKAQQVLRQQMHNQSQREEALRRREIEIRLQEAEIRELREIAESETSRERAALAQERIRIAHLREALKRGSDRMGPPRDSDPNLRA
jgi:hypothetical protein